MVRTNKAVSVGVTATAICSASDAASRFTIVNNGAATVYLGDANVTTVNGLPLAAGACYADVIGSGGGVLYGIVASSTCDVRVLEG
jgi:hypothetical protein